MILTKQTTELSRSGISGEKQYAINLSGKMYSMLTDGLYSDKIGSVVREVCSNAYDAHIAAGTPELPFHVTLPTNLEPHFIVEDFGTGLPDDRCQELYSTLGLSTKELSNDMIGAFGLGSKSPFAVTDTFTIENCYDGKTFYYMCFKDEQGLPSILPTGSVDTPDRHPGIKIIIPAAGRQFDEYWFAMRRQLAMMKVKPKITNKGGYEFAEMQALFENEDGIVVANASDFGLSSRKVYAQMGIVLYPIHQTYNVVSFPIDKLRGDSCLILKFGIGELEPLPSREDLSITEATKELIKERSKNFRDYVDSELDKTVEMETIPLLAYRKALQLANSYDYSYNHREYVISGEKYRFNELVELSTYEHTEETRYPDPKDPTKEIINSSTYDLGSYYGEHRERWSWGSGKNKMVAKDLKTISWRFIDDIENGTVKLFYVDDEKFKYKNQRIEKMINMANSRDDAYLIYCRDPIVPAFNADHFKDMLDSIHHGLGDKVILVSDIQLEDYEKPKRNTKTGVVGGVDITIGGITENLKRADVEDLDYSEMFYYQTEDGVVVNEELTLEQFRSFSTYTDIDSFNVKKSGGSFLKTIAAENVKTFTEMFESLMVDYEPSETLISLLNQSDEEEAIGQYNYDKAFYLEAFMKNSGIQQVPEYMVRYVDIYSRREGRHEIISTLTQKADYVVLWLWENARRIIEKYKDQEWYKKLRKDNSRLKELYQDYQEAFPYLQASIKKEYTYGNTSPFTKTINYLYAMAKYHVHKLIINPFGDKDENQGCLF